MATDHHEIRERVSKTECDREQQEGAAGIREGDAAVYKQLVERVRALEESLKKMESEEGGEDAESRGAASCNGRAVLYSGIAERMGGKKGEGALESCYAFQMPMHYPRYRKADYESMPEWRLDRLLQEYGLPVNVASTLAEKREYAMGVFLWGNQRGDH